MAGQAFFNNGINVASGWSTLLNGLLARIANELDFQEQYAGYKTDLMFMDEPVLNEQQTYSGIAGPLELDAINENSVKPEGERTKLPNKGFRINEYGEKITTSFLFYQWIQKSRTIKGAGDDIKREWMNLAENGRFLIESAMLRMAIDMLKVYTNWFGVPTTTYGAGSPTPKGNPLFSIQHTSRNGALQWRNMGRGAFLNSALDADALQDALHVIKNVVRLENGLRVPILGRPYELITWSELAVTARQIINEDSSGSPDQYSGKNSNSKEHNQFWFRGNKVNLIEIPMLGDLDKHGNPIGTPNMWFLRNPEYISKARAFKMLKLYEPRLKNYSNDDTDAYIVDIRIGFAVDHYGAECGIYWSKGDGDVAYAV